MGEFMAYRQLQPHQFTRLTNQAEWCLDRAAAIRKLTIIQYDDEFGEHGF